MENTNQTTQQSPSCPKLGPAIPPRPGSPRPLPVLAPQTSILSRDRYYPPQARDTQRAGMRSRLWSPAPRRAFPLVNTRGRDEDEARATVSSAAGKSPHGAWEQPIGGRRVSFALEPPVVLPETTGPARETRRRHREMVAAAARRGLPRKSCLKHSSLAAIVEEPSLTLTKVPTPPPSMSDEKHWPSLPCTQVSVHTKPSRKRKAAGPPYPVPPRKSSLIGDEEKEAVMLTFDSEKEVVLPLFATKRVQVYNCLAVAVPAEKPTEKKNKCIFRCLGCTRSQPAVQPTAQQYRVIAHRVGTPDDHVSSEMRKLMEVINKEIAEREKAGQELEFDIWG